MPARYSSMNLSALGLIFGLLMGGCTDDPQLSSSSQSRSALEASHHLSVDGMTLRLAPTHEDWVADPVDEDAVISNFKSVVLRGERAVLLQVQGDWSEFQLSNGNTGWALSDTWVPGTLWYAGTTDISVKMCLDAACLKTEMVPPLTLMVVNTKATYGKNEVRFGDRTGYIQSEYIQLDDESVFFAFQVIRAEWSLANANLENNGRILDKARIKYPESRYLDILADRIPFVDFTDAPHVDTSDLEALQLMRKTKRP